MDYTQESVDALVAATQAAHDQLGVASVELAKAASLSSAAMDAAANLVHVSPPKPPTTLRKAYLGSSDFSALTGTTPTCHRHYYGLSGNGFNPQAALSRTQDDAKANRLTLLSIGPAGVAGKPDLNALSAFYPALKANPNLAFIPWPTHCSTRGGKVSCSARSTGTPRCSRWRWCAATPSRPLTSSCPT